MAQAGSDWTASQRRRWMRPNAHLYMRPDAHRWLRPDWKRFLVPGADPGPLLALFEGKANFNPNQPRVPAGNPDGGQWTDDQGWAGNGGSEADEETDYNFDLDEFSDSKRARLARPGSRPHGHHYVSVEIYGRMNLSAETRKVFDEEKTGRLHSHVHGNSKEHEMYTEAVGQLLKKYMIKNDIREESMTPVQARRFVDEVKRSNDPRIRDFNMRIWRRELMYWIRRAGRGRE